MRNSEKPLYNLAQQVMGESMQEEVDFCCRASTVGYTGDEIMQWTKNRIKQEKETSRWTL